MLCRLLVVLLGGVLVSSCSCSCSLAPTALSPLLQACREASRELRLTDPDAGIDPELMRPLIEPIDRALDDLVEAGEFVEQSFRVEAADRTFPELDPEVRRLGERYGETAAREMLDCGIRWRCTALPDDGVVSLTMRVPLAELPPLQKFLRDNGWGEALP